MSNGSKRQYLVDSIAKLLEQYGDQDFSDLVVKSHVQSTVSTFLLQCQISHIVYQATVSVHFKDFGDMSAGYEVDIHVWYEPNSRRDYFTLHAIPNKPTITKEDPAVAYDRAMGIL